MSSTLELESEPKGITKQQVRDFVPKRIKELRFGVLSAGDIVNQSVVEVSDRHVYDFSNASGERPTTKNGPLDKRMGVSVRNTRCETCGRPDKECNGHFGHVKLALPAFHIGFMKKIVEILQGICKDCSRVLLTDKECRALLERLRRHGIDNVEKKMLVKKVNTEARKVTFCPHCGGTNGSVKKVAGHALKIIHDRYRKYNASTAKGKVAPRSKIVFDKSFDEARKSNPEIEKHVKKALDDMNPLRVLNLFRKIKNEDCELLGMDPSEARPEMLIWQYVPAPPVPIRPSVQQDSASNEDDITNKLGDIIQISSMIRAGIEKGVQLQQLMEQWEYLQIQVAMIINSDQPSLQQPGFGKTIRSFCQRLKGKGGRFRGNLSGKRVDFSGRTVISPDPNLSVEEVAVPERVAKNLTYPERCNSTNLEKLRGLVLRGGLRHPGANFVEKGRDGRKTNLAIAGPTGEKIRKSAAQNLEIGDVVLRHLEDGDIVLFNRQPSLHKLSIMCHRVKVRQWRTFRLNECVCSPYNADFDGDEMNLHVPQTEEARTEALELMGVKYNLATPKDGTPIIASTQDFITASYLLSSKDRFYDRAAFTQICNYMFRGKAAQDELRAECAEGEMAKNGGHINIELPEPAIWKPRALWTGKQVFNVLLRPNKASKILINLDASCKKFKAEPNKAHDLVKDDSWLVIRNSELMCGLIDKNTAGGGKKESIFYILLRDYGPEAAVRCMNRIARLSARWLTNEGFSIGLTDVWPGSKLVQRKSNLITDAYTKCDDVIRQYKNGTLEANPGSSLEATMETKLSAELSEVRNNAAKICFEEMSSWNSPVIMALSGSKGSNMNVSQMIASVGQQIIASKRIQDGFQDRTLPHFPKGAPQPPSRGFVANSFFSGLIPSEFIFHAMSGREGLVDTAVKTAETGYMSRRLMKSLEDLGAQYDLTVRTAANNIVQFLYGEDGLDPLDMEGKGKPVDYARVWLHAQTVTWNNEDAGMLPWHITEYVKQVMDRERQKSQRTSIMNEPLDYDTNQTDQADDKEFHRRFLDEIEEHAGKLSGLVALARKFVGLDSHERAPENTHDCDEQRQRGTQSGTLLQNKLETSHGNAANQLCKVSRRALDEFLSICLSKYEKARVQPGHAVGAVGAQSIGEPGTQMTLKTFHFAGVAGMSLTQGVPRIKEIINASKTISTPIIKCDLHAWDDIRVARMAVAEIEKSYIHDVADHMDEVWLTDRVFLEIKINEEQIRGLGLNVRLLDIRNAIARTKGLGLSDDCIRVNDQRSRIVITMPDLSAKARSKTKDQEDDYYLRLQTLKRLLPKVVIKGYFGVSKVLMGKGSEDKMRGKKKPLSKIDPRPIPKDEHGNDKETYKLYVEGYGLKECLTCPYVDFRTVEPNNIMECFSCLGIEAARQCIIKEINETLGSSMGIDPRHMQLLADVMTFKGDVLGITRFGLAKMRDSVLQLASFEKTPDHLFDAAIGSKADKIEGVSECIIMGQSMTIGTGAMRVVKLLDLGEEDFVKSPTYFEDACSRKHVSLSAAA